MQKWQDERRAVANACRVLAYRGLVDGILGHVSLKITDSTALVRCRGPQERGLAFTTVDDIREIGLDGSHSLPDGWSAPNELPLHLAVLNRSPEDVAVVHAHPPAVVAMSLVNQPLRPIVGAFNIPAMAMATTGIPTYASSALIRNSARGQEMLDAMGGGAAVVLAGHGLTTSGTTLAQAVVRALTVDALARMHLAVLSTGTPPPTIPDADRADLPDLGSAFNDEHTYRFHLAEIEHAGLLIREDPS